MVVQQDSFIEDQRQALSERSSSCTSLSRPSSRPSSLIEQEKQRSLEKQRQELASLQRQQAAHAEEKRRREKEWELREKQLAEREAQVHAQVTMHHLPLALFIINSFRAAITLTVTPQDGFMLQCFTSCSVLSDKLQCVLVQGIKVFCGALKRWYTAFKYSFH